MDARTELSRNKIELERTLSLVRARHAEVCCLAMHCTCMNAKHSALVFVLVIISIVLVLVLVIISISIAMHCTCMKAKHSACVPNVTLACRVCVRKTPASLLRGTNIL